MLWPTVSYHLGPTFWAPLWAPVYLWHLSSTERCTGPRRHSLVFSPLSVPSEPWDHFSSPGPPGLCLNPNLTAQLPSLPCQLSSRGSLKPQVLSNPHVLYEPAHWSCSSNLPPSDSFCSVTALLVFQGTNSTYCQTIFRFAKGRLVHCPVQALSY